MKFAEFVGPSYRTPSPRLGCEETINLYLEVNERLRRKQFYRSPGLMRVWDPADEFPVVGMLQVFARIEVEPADRNPRIFAIIGDQIYEFDFEIDPPVPGYAQTAQLVSRGSQGPVANNGRPATMTSDPADTQLVFVSAQRAYRVFEAALAELTWFGVAVTQVQLINNYFLFLSSEGDGFFYSEPGDASDGDPLNFRSVESANDNFIALIVDRNVDIWVFGAQTTQIFYNDPGDPDEPFKPNPSGAMQTGIASPDCAIACNNSVFWIDEHYIFRQADGYIPKVIPFSQIISAELRTYGDISDCYVWTVTWNGHIVIRWTFPTAIVDIGNGAITDGMTWQYDTTTGDWTRQLGYIESTGTWTAHRGLSTCDPIKGRQLVGDRSNGAIYMMTPDVQTDDCTRVPWLRRSPIINEEGYNVSYPRFELGMETGVGRPLGDLADPTCAVTPVLPVPDEACGALTGDIEFVWEHNSRVGPFMGTERGEIFFIGRDPNDEKRLVVAKTTNFGEEWALVDDVFPVLTNNILSFDCHDKDTENGDLDYILVGTQEAVGSGRVACHIFSKITSTWTLLDSQVVASAAIMAGGANDNGGCVSMTVLANGNFGCMYDTDPEDVGGTDYFRYGFRISTDSGATWSAEEQEEQAGIAWHFVCARAIADNDGRVQLGSGNSVSPGFGHYTFQTRRADGSYSVVTVTFEGGALSQVQQGRCIGDYCTWEEGGSTKIAVPGRTLEDARYAIFTSVDDMILEDVNQAVTGTTFMASGTALYPQTAMSFAGGLLHIMGNKFDNSVPTWTWHKSIESPYMTPTPSGAEEDQAGPIYSILGEGIPEQELAAKVVEMDGETYFVTLRRSGTAGLGLVFNWIKTSLLPTSDAFTIGEWSEACPTANVPASDPTSELPWADDLTLSPEFDPLIYLKYSNDWGKSWSNELYRSIGKSGQYSKQLIWDRLGSGRQRVFEIGSSAAVPIAIDEAYIGEPEALKR